MINIVRCNKCGHEGPEDEFPKGRDFFQNPFIAGCSQSGCSQRQSPGDASMRGFGGERPFSYVGRTSAAPNDLIGTVIQRSSDAS